MQQRTLRISISKSGGNSGAGTMSHKMTIPNVWIKEMGITKEDRTCIVIFDGKTITIRKADAE